MSLTKAFTPVANAVAHWTGRPLTFIVCCLLVLVWALSGPMFGFSDTWQLVINTSTTVVTFLMVFLIQNTQNRDNLALQVKLDELIRASRAPNRFIGIEHMTDEELEAMVLQCEQETETRAVGSRGPSNAALRAFTGPNPRLAKARGEAARRAAKRSAKPSVKRL